MNTPEHSADLTWPALLAHWTAFAQSTLALPKNAIGDRWRAATPAIIGLQALVHALGDLDRLSPSQSAEAPDGERALAIDKAEMLVKQHASELHVLWGKEPLHAEVGSLIADARAAIVAARSQGWEWRVTEDRLVADHPAEVVELILDTGFDGDLYLPTPGVTLFRDCPAAFARAADGSRPNERTIRAVKEFLIDVSRPEAMPSFRQAYRQFDFAKGKVVRDLVVGFADALPSGQPLLVPAILDGKPVGVTLPPRKGAETPTIPVVFEQTRPTPGT